VAINTGVNVSKLVAYAVLTPPVGVNVSKLNAYAVLALPTGVNVSKVNAYAVLTSGNVTPPIWGSFLFGDGTRGVAYSQSWDMPSSAEIVTYSVLSGALPDGLSLSVVSHNVAKISGTPTVTNTFSFTLRATNTYGTADQAFSITINDSSGGMILSRVRTGF
jgi:hypothetical protein